MLVECDPPEAFSIRFIPRAIEPPLDIEWLAEWLGIEVEVRPLPSKVAGFYMRTKNRPHAVINSKDSPQRRRWTLAHEIAHHIMGMVTRVDSVFELYSKQSSSKKDQNPHSIDERACDRFTAELLMPAQLVKKLAAEVEHGRYDRTAILAGKFEVSVTAMRIRLRELGLSGKRRAKG